MKILHITNALSSGGVTTLLLEILPFLAKEHEVSLLLLGENTEKYLLDDKLKNIKVTFLNQKSFYSIKNIFKIRNMIKENDITHTHLFPTQYIVFLATLFLSKKIITTEHNAWNNRRKYFIFKIIEKIIYKKYSKIIAVSEAAKKNLVNWIKMEKKIVVIPNGIDLEKYKGGKNIRSELWDLKENEKLICMVARFSKYKDHKTLIDSMKILPQEIKCIFVGIGETLEEMKKYVKKNELGNRVKFLGYRNDIVNIFKSCDLSILSSNTEGFGIVAVESMASGTITLGSNVDGLNEILKYEDFLFEKGNEKELAEKIKLFLNDNEKIINKKKKLIEKNVINYSLNNMLNKYKKVYIEVLNENI